MGLTRLASSSPHRYSAISVIGSATAAAASWPAGLALIAEHHHERRVEMMGFALMGSTAGSLLGPVIGGSLYQAGGYTLPFAVTGVLVTIDAALCVFLLPRDQGGRAATPEIRSLLLDKS